MASRGGLTDLRIRNLKPDPSKRLEIPDGRQAGLYLILQPSGRRRFCVRYRANGKTAKLTLRAGLSLADARKAAADAMFSLEKGSDPREARRTEKQKADAAAVNTLAYVCQRYIKREGGKLRSIKDRESTLRRLVLPVLGDRQIDTIKRTEISQLLDKIEDANGPRAASLALAYLRTIFNWYAVQSDTFSSPIVPGMDRYSIAENRRKRFLSDDEIRTLWKATEGTDRPCAAVLRFLLLTGCRKNEGAGLRWDEIQGNAWLLPASRHKNKRVDLLRPLSDAALAVVRAQPRIDNSPYVFTTTGKQRIDMEGAPARRFRKSLGIVGWRTHDLRRTARTLLSRAKIDSDISEKCLGHLPSGLRDTYDQHKYQNELAHAFAELAALVQRIVEPPPSVVTPLRRKRHAKANA